MYTDEFLKEMLNYPNEKERGIFFDTLDCDNCPLRQLSTCKDDCEAMVRAHYYGCAETSSEKNEPTPEKEEPSIEENEPAAANTQPEEEEINIRELVALRRDVNRKYNQLRDKIFVNLVEEMYKTGKFHTAEELSDMCGLSINTIANIFKNCRLHYHQHVVGNYYLETNKGWKRTTYVRLLPNGEVDMSRQVDQCREVLTYKIVKREF